MRVRASVATSSKVLPAELDTAPGVSVRAVEGMPSRVGKYRSKEDVGDRAFIAAWAWGTG